MTISSVKYSLNIFIALIGSPTYLSVVSSKFLRCINSPSFIIRDGILDEIVYHKYYWILQ